MVFDDSPRNRRSYHVVPTGHCWVEGDNGRSSNDSNHFGVVCTNEYIGVIMLSWYVTGVTGLDKSTCTLCNMATI